MLLENVNIYLHTAGKKGLGIFALRAFTPGEIIEKCPVLCFEGMVQFLTPYLFSWGQEEALPLGYGALYNHSEHENAFAKRNYEQQCLEITALKNIQPHEEIVLNYGPQWFSCRQQEVLE